MRSVSSLTDLASIWACFVHGRRSLARNRVHQNLRNGRNLPLGVLTTRDQKSTMDPPDNQRPSTTDSGHADESQQRQIRPLSRQTSGSPLPAVYEMVSRALSTQNARSDARAQRYDPLATGDWRDMSSPSLAIAAHQTDWEYRVTWLLWLCCALSSTLIIVVQTIPAIIFLCAVLLYCALFPLRFYQALTWNIIPWAIVLFGALSVIWSEQPTQSLRSAAQIWVSVLAVLMFAQGLRAGSFILITFFAFVGANATFLFAPSVFGSKNMVGQTLALVVLSSFWLILDRQHLLIRAIALAALLAAPSMLIAADSEGALLAGSLALVCSLAPFLMRPFRPATRIFLACVGAFVASVIILASFLLFDGLFETILQSIGKDVSLTGRTLLWSHAAEIIADHPLGVGLQAFWNESNADAIRFWETFYINNHYGFHFHDLWLETGVELGVIGIVIAAATTLVVFFSVWRWALWYPAPESCFFAGYVTFILARTIGEVELYSQFNMTSMMFIAAFYYARSPSRQQADNRGGHG